jgi:hypothetical protein
VPGVTKEPLCPARRGAGVAGLRRHREQRIGEVVCRQVGVLSASSELLGELTRGSVGRLLNSRLPRDVQRTAADWLRAIVETVLHGADLPRR